MGVDETEAIPFLARDGFSSRKITSKLIIAIDGSTGRKQHEKTGSVDPKARYGRP